MLIFVDDVVLSLCDVYSLNIFDGIQNSAYAFF